LLAKCFGCNQIFCGYNLPSATATDPRIGPDKAAAARLAHARIVRADWGAGYPGVRTSMDLPFSRAVARVVGEAMGGAPLVLLPNIGGSLPLYALQEVLGAPVIIVPIVNHDNNQHAANENLRLRNLWDGIDVFATLFAELGGAWPAPG